MSLEEIHYVSQLISTLALLVSVICLGRQTHLVAKGPLKVAAVWRDAVPSPRQAVATPAL